MTPDAAKILADLHRHATCFDLTAEKLGESLCKVFTDGVQDCIWDEVAPDGTAWAPLSAAYEEQKNRQFPTKPIGVRLGLMASPEQVAGDVIIFYDQAFVTYGTDQDAREEATNFQEGGPNQPPRPFWGFTAKSLQATEAILTARFKKVVG